MTSTLDSALRQVLALSHYPIRWRDQGIWYETLDFGNSLTVSEEPKDVLSSRMENADREAIQFGRIQLVQTPFCDPRVWWQFSTQQAKAPIVPLFFHKGRLILGPAFSESGSICPTCAALRLAQGFPRPDIFESMLRGRPQASAELLGVLHNLLHLDELQGFVEKHLERLLDGELLSVKSTETSQEASWHRILPPPGMHPTHYVNLHTAQLFGIPEMGAWNGTELGQISDAMLIDPLVGPLIATRLLPAEKQEPRELVGAATITGSLGHFTYWCPDANGSGCNFESERATLASIGEAVERYCGNVVPDMLLWSSERDLAQVGRRFLSQRCFHYWSSLQTTSPLWPLAEVSEETSIPWVEGVSLVSQGERVLLPAEVVYLKMTQMTGGKARYPVNLAGIAAHRSCDAAREAALLEIIERDATMVFWHGGRPVMNLIDLPPVLSAKLSDGGDPQIRQWYLLLETEFPVAVTAVCLHDQEHNVLVVGFAAPCAPKSGCHRSHGSHLAKPLPGSLL